jgi:hypothetical protein
VLTLSKSNSAPGRRRRPGPAKDEWRPLALACGCTVLGPRRRWQLPASLNRSRPASPARPHQPHCDYRGTPRLFKGAVFAISLYDTECSVNCPRSPGPSAFGV